MLWQVERILDECTELPQVLVMENVPDVVGVKNITLFAEWVQKLESLGYKNYWQVLNGKDYGIPQNRERCFMVSVLGDYYYEFPKKMPLKVFLKDILEENVDESYYISEDRIPVIVRNVRDKNSQLEPSCLRYVRTEEGKALRKQYENHEIEHGFNEHKVLEIKQDGCSNCLTTVAKDNLIINPIVVKEGTKKGYAEAYPGDSINLAFPTSETRRGRVGKGVAQTLTTSCTQGVVTEDARLYFVGHGWTPESVIGLKVYPTITTSSWEHNNMVVEADYRVRKLTPIECWRLMGVKDEDCKNAMKNQSNSSMYHLAGDSIIVNVLMEIFKPMFE